MTEIQRKFLTEYLGECWKGDIIDGICERCGTIFSTNRTFDTAQDKQDLLMRIISNGEWIDFRMAYAGRECCADYSVFFIKLSPIATAELICKWKGVE